jgi:hypothetical protein
MTVLPGTAAAAAAPLAINGSHLVQHAGLSAPLAAPRLVGGAR